MNDVTTVAVTTRLVHWLYTSSLLKKVVVGFCAWITHPVHSLAVVALLESDEDDERVELPLLDDFRLVELEDGLDAVELTVVRGGDEDGLVDPLETVEDDAAA